MAPFNKLLGQVERLASRSAARAMDLAASVWAELPDVTVCREGDQLSVSGRGLMRRWLADGQLRFALWRSR